MQFLRRRQFLRATLATVSGWTLGCADAGEPAIDTGNAQDGHELFPQSVASGDPRSESLILWTRVEIPDVEDEDVELYLELFADEELTQAAMWEEGPLQALVATAKHDHCVKVRVVGLEPATVYYYRFVAQVGDDLFASRTGRTKTAPAKDADTPVKFAFVSCQDFGGRWFNGYAQLVTKDPDFFVHLGDYIYETAGDSGFQGGTEGREVVFEDSGNVLVVDPNGDGGYQAARSLANYRQLYRIHRSDPALQRVHERLPMIATWDDHEFADDCWGATATYFSGREDETDPDRRRNANQAWFEYMPVDYLEPEFEYDRKAQPPDDMQIWRDFVFGRHLHLVMTDLRSRRSDHLIPEDAYPGTVVVTESELAGDTEFAAAYVESIAGEQAGAYAQLLRSHATAAGYPSDAIEGPISVAWVNSVIESEGSDLTPIDPAGRPLGIAYVDMMKGSFWSRIGSRYLVASGPFARFAAKRWADSDRASETAMGPEQEEWFLDTMRASKSTWKVWGNEFCLSPLQIDLSLLMVPDSFKRVFHLNVDDWNGMGNRRDLLLAELADVGNVVAITGDIHAFFAGTPMVSTDTSRKIVEFVGGSISSLAFQSLLQAQVEADPVLSAVPGATALAGAIRDLLLDIGPNPHLAFAEVQAHGWAMVEVSADTLDTTFFTHAEAEVEVNHYEDENIDELFTAVRFRVEAGSPELYRDFSGEWKRWDPTTRTFV